MVMTYEKFTSFLQTSNFRKATFFLVLFLSVATIANIYLVQIAQNTNIGGQDFQHHYEMANGIIEDTDVRYPPFFYTISSPFVYNVLLYYYFTLILTFFIAPLILFFVSKHWSSVFFYYVFSAVFRIELSGAYPQLIMSVWLIVFLFWNNFWFRLFSLFAVLFVHAWGFPLLLLAWFCVELFKRRDFDLRNLVLGCGALLGDSIGYLNNSRPRLLIVSLGDIVRFLGRDLNLLGLVVGLYGFVLIRRWDVIVLCGLLFCVALTFNGRILYTLALLMGFGVSFAFQKLVFRWKLFLFGFGLLMVVWNFHTWFLDKYVGFLGRCP